jgi:hypothetical protein
MILTLTENFFVFLNNMSCGAENVTMQPEPTQVSDSIWYRRVFSVNM